MRRRRAMKHEAGQALVTLLAFVAMAMTLTAAATTVTLVNFQTTSKYAVGEEALAAAEGGADNAVMRLIRDPTYTGETMAVGNGTATITISGTTTKTITSEGALGSFRRRVQVIVTQSNNTVVVTSWSQID